MVEGVRAMQGIWRAAGILQAVNGWSSGSSLPPEQAEAWIPTPA